MAGVSNNRIRHWTPNFYISIRIRLMDLKKIKAKKMLIFSWIIANSAIQRPWDEVFVLLKMED